MKILISTDTYYPHVNGASYFTGRLANQLKERGHEVLVIAPSTNFTFGFSDRYGVKVFGVRSFYLPNNHNFRFVLPFGIEKEIEKVVFDFAPDIIHVQGHFSVSKNVIRAARKIKTPIMGTTHFMPDNLTHYLHLPKFLENQVSKWAWNDFRKVFESLDTVTTPTETAASLVRKIGFSKEIHAVSCGIDLIRFNPSKKDVNLKKKYNLPDLPLILYVGRIDKEKNIDLIIKSLAKIPKDVKFHLAIGGNGAEKKKLEELSRKLGVSEKITFLGFMPDEDLPILYASSYCFINAGTAELQCIAMMEAMASGLPVLGVDAVALPELVHENENGYLFQSGDTEKLSKLMTVLLSDHELAQKMGQKSLEIIKPHDIKKVMERFEFLYEETIKKYGN